MKKIIAFALFITIIASLFSACGSSEIEPSTQATTVETTQPFDIVAYKTAVSDCVTDLNNWSRLLLLIAEYEKTLWEVTIRLDGTATTERLISSSEEWYIEQTGHDFQSIRDHFDNIAARYKVIVTTPIDGAEAEEIETAFKDYFDTFIGVYNFVLSPSGSYSSFSDQYDTYVTDVANHQSKMDILLG